jgi:ribosomal protein S18 acetylase RimI-like enzyme
MIFSYNEERLTTEALELRYHLTPWDIPILGANVAAISLIKIHTESAAGRDYAGFRDWCDRQRVVLVSCRLPQERLAECGFLEARGFRFIELNYLPRLDGLGKLFFDDADREIEIMRADLEDQAEIAGIAGQIYDTGRFHVDPLLGPEIGNRRYRTWASNAFHLPRQDVLKCVLHGKIVAFMVVEESGPASRFWSLVGLAPGLAGQGIGRRVWRAMLNFHRQEGVDEVSTSISSQNVRVHNLYVSLGFRFPPPLVTLHWCPFGRVVCRIPLSDSNLFPHSPDGTVFWGARALNNV